MELAAAPAWTVVPVFKRLSKADKKAGLSPDLKHYELRFGTICQEKSTSEHGAQTLREIATFLNRRKLEPRPRIECAADAPNPQKYLKDLSQ